MRKNEFLTGFTVGLCVFGSVAENKGEKGRRANAREFVKAEYLNIKMLFPFGAHIRFAFKAEDIKLYARKHIYFAFICLL